MYKPTLSTFGRWCTLHLLMLCLTMPALADGSLSLLQYELSFKGREPVSSFYLGYRPAFLPGNSFASAGENLIRLPLYSTDPAAFSLFNYQDSTAEGGAGLETLVLGGLILWGIGTRMQEINDSFDNFEVDLSGIEIPEIDPSTIPPKSPAQPE